MIETYTSTLLLTIAAELIVAAAITRGKRPAYLLLFVLAINLTTHPIASFLMQLPDLALGFWPVEALVICCEILLYLKFAGLDFIPAAKLSLACNSVTIALSLLFL